MVNFYFIKIKNMEPIELDTIDLQLLDSLQRDASLSNVALAEARANIAAIAASTDPADFANTIDALEQAVADRYATPLQVPVTAIYSKRDGIVAWQACIDKWSPDVRHIEVSETHIGLGFSPRVLGLVADVEIGVPVLRRVLLAGRPLVHGRIFGAGDDSRLCADDAVAFAPGLRARELAFGILVNAV